MFPCTGKQSATDQVNAMISQLDNVANGMYGTIWLDVETNPSPGCSWKQWTPEQNCQFIQELVDAVRDAGKTPGIYSSRYQWENVFGVGNYNYCSQVSDVPLWYSHYDGKKNFNRFKSFAGWSEPDMKQYLGDKQMCGCGVDFNWYP